jgi:hypothetical protein
MVGTKRAKRMYAKTLGLTLTGFLAWSLLSVSAAMADVIYERPITPEEEKWYVVGGSGETLPKGETMEQAKERLSKEDFSKNKALVKVEIERDPDSGRLIVWYRILRGGKDSQALLEQWRKEAPEFWLGGQVRGLRCTGSSAKMNDGTAVFFEDLRLVRALSESFRAEDGTGTDVYAFIAPGRDIANHEFLRNIIKRPNLRLEANATGNFVTCDDSGDAKTAAHCIGWIAPNGMVIYIGCQHGEISDELMQLYVRRYPTILDKKIDLEKTHWGREEVDLWMGHLEKVVVGKDREPDPLGFDDWFHFYAGRMRLTCDVPPLKDFAENGRDRTKDAAALAELREWWKANRADSLWDERIQKLVVPVKKMEDGNNVTTKAANDRAALNAPMAEDGVAAAKRALVADFEDSLLRDVQLLSSTDGWAGLVKLSREGNGWVMTFPGVNKKGEVRKVYSGPMIVTSNDAAFPLKATFGVEVSDSQSGERHHADIQYQFERATGRWTKASNP